MGGFLGNLFGSNQAKAARNAAAEQERMAREGIAYRKEQSEIARGDFEPYSQAGRDTLGGMQDLITSPSSQRDYIQNNPFFSSLADQSSRELMANQAARGKLGSGETAEALQNSLLTLGTDLVNQSIAQRQGLVNTGFNASANQAGISERLGGNVAGDLVGIGNVQGAGTMGAANARAKGAQNILDLGFKAGGLVACDIRLKKDIVKVGNLHNGLPLYSFKYKNDPKQQVHINVMAQDVEQVKPEAVREIDGFKYVNLNQLCH